MRKTLEERFFAKVRKTDTCWEWIGAKSWTGYGHIRFNGVVRKSSRVIWQLTYGDIPKGLCVLHSCDNPSCVNPAHLRLGTQKENVLEMHSKKRAWQNKVMFCSKGHPYDEKNTWKHNKFNERRCRKCHAEYSRRFYHVKRIKERTQLISPPWLEFS